jgi:hypothetical protein
VLTEASGSGHGDEEAQGGHKVDAGWVWVTFLAHGVDGGSEEERKMMDE